MKRIRCSILLVLFIVLVSCTDQEPIPTQEAPSGTEMSEEAERVDLVIGLIGPLSDGSNLTSYEPATRLMQALIHRALFTLDEHMQIAPDLASSYEVEMDTEGSRIWYIRLRPGLSFSDGTALRTEDVVASLNQAKTQGLSDSFTDSWEEVWRVDGDRIAVRETEKDNNLLYDLSQPSAYILKRQDLTITDFTKAPGLGDYTIKAFSAGQAVLQKRQGAAEGIESIVLKVYSEEADGLLRLEQGDLDAWLAPSGAVFNALQQNPAFRYIRVPSLTQTWLGFNTEIWPFNDPEVRLAIAQALDKKKLLQVALEGDGQVSRHVDPWQNLAGSEVSGPDLEAARAHLKKAGITGPSVRLDILTTDQSKLLMYEVIKDNLEALGMRVNAVSMDFDTYVSTIREGDYKAYIGGYTLAQPEVFLNDMFSSAKIGNTNVARFKDRKVDTWLAGLRSDLEQKLFPDRQELTAYLDEKMPFVPLFQSMHHLIYHKNLEGVKLRADGTIHPSQWRWKR